MHFIPRPMRPMRRGPGSEGSPASVFGPHFPLGLSLSLPLSLSLSLPPSLSLSAFLAQTQSFSTYEAAHAGADVGLEEELLKREEERGRRARREREE